MFCLGAQFNTYNNRERDTYIVRNCEFGAFLARGNEKLCLYICGILFLPDCGILANLSVCVDLNGISIS